VLLSGAAQRLRRELALCTNLSDCGERALSLLQELSGAGAGYFYLLQRDLPVLLASSHGDPPPALRRELESFVAGLAQDDDSATQLVDATLGLTATHSAIDGDDGVAYSVFEVVAPDTKRVVAAIALSFSPDTPRTVAGELIAVLGDELLARADFTRITTLTQ
jgi:hypothetical protein